MHTFFIDKRNFLVVFAIVVAAIMPLSVFAAGAFDAGTPSGSYNAGTPSGNSDAGCTPGTICNPLGNIKGFCGFIKALFVAVGTIAVPIAVLFLVYAGFLFVYARGSAEGLTKAKNNLFYTILGIAIFFAAWLLALAIGNTLSQFGVSVIGSC